MMNKLKKIYCRWFGHNYIQSKFTSIWWERSADEDWVQRTKSHDGLICERCKKTQLGRIEIGKHVTQISNLAIYARTSHNKEGIYEQR